jgi:hypothetical protein
MILHQSIGYESYIGNFADSDAAYFPAQNIKESLNEVIVMGYSTRKMKSFLAYNKKKL